ncbi:hypothetical protein VTK26DRAFT_1697 [Humicola hyalothermophila]
MASETDDSAELVTTAMPTPTESPGMPKPSGFSVEMDDKTDDKNSRQATAVINSPREAKKQRLRELKAEYSYVGTITSHMARQYNTIPPPPWLDLRAVAAQLSRSTQRGASHTAWGGLRGSLSRINAWMGNHRTWKEAVQVAKMPYIGTRSEIFALEFIVMPRTLAYHLTSAKLDFLLDPEPCSSEDLSMFWRGSDIDNPQWRTTYMERHVSIRHLPFDDDLTDLVVSTVCNKPKKSLATVTSPSRPSNARDSDKDDVIAGPTGGVSEMGKPIKKEDHGEYSSNCWGEQGQATVSRGVEVGSGPLEAENPSSPRKRDRHEDSTANGHHKRCKTALYLADADQPIDTIESSESDGSPILHKVFPSITKDDGQSEFGHGNARKEVQQTAGHCTESPKKRATSKEKSRHLKEIYARLADKLRSIESENQRLAAQCATLETEMKKLEGQKSRSDALEDANKSLQTQMAAVLSRIEALEAQATQQTEAEPNRAAAPQDAQGEPTGAGGTATPGSTSARRPPIQAEGVEKAFDRVVGFVQQGDERTVVSQPGWTVQGRRITDLRSLHTGQHAHDPTQQPSYKRALSQLPRIPELPTFDVVGQGHTTNQPLFSQPILPSYSFPASLSTSSSHLEPSHLPFLPSASRFRSKTIRQTPAPTLVDPLPSLRPLASSSTNTAPTVCTQSHHPEQPTIADCVEHPAIRAHLSWVPAAYRDALVSFLVRLDQRVWTAPCIQDIVAHCEAQGLRYERTHRLVACFRRVLREVGGLDQLELGGVERGRGR